MYAYCDSMANFCFLIAQGETPLIVATKKEMTHFVQLLINRGADINRKDHVKYLRIREIKPNNANIY